MQSFHVAILCLCICSTAIGQTKQDEIEKLVDELSKESVDATAGLKDVSSWGQVDVAAELLRREVKVRETAEFLALEAMKDSGRGRFLRFEPEYAREAFYSLGPRNTIRVTELMSEWLAGDFKPHVDAAGAALLRMGEPGPEQIPLLTKNLDSPMVEKRIWACKLLRTMGEPAKVALADVRTCMKDSDESVRLEAAKLVGLWDQTDRECVRVLADLISDDKELTRKALRGLESLGPRAVEVAARVVPLLVDHDTGRPVFSNRSPDTFRPGLRSPAQEVLDAMGPGNRARVLLKSLRTSTTPTDLRNEICREILSAIAFDSDLPDYTRYDSPPPISDRGRLELWLRPGPPPRPLSRLDRIAFPVIQWLSSPSILNTWLKLDQSPRRQTWIVRRFAVLGHAPSSLNRLLQSPDLRVQLNAIRTMSSVGDVDARELTPLTCSEDQRTRRMATQALGKTSKSTRDTAIRHLKTLLADKDLWVRTEACVALHELKHPAEDMLAAIQPILADRSRSENEQNAALRVVETLGPAAAPVVAEMLVLRNGDSSSQTLTEATAAIGPAAIPGLIKQVKSSRLRRQAVVALGKIGPPARRAIPTLVRLQPEPTSEEALELARAIALIQQKGEIALLGIRRVLKIRHRPSLVSRFRPHSVFDLIAELGPAARPLIPALTRMVEVDEFQHISNRLDAAYVLAVIDPNEPKWRVYLERHDATYRLSDLDKHKNGAQ